MSAPELVRGGAPADASGHPPRPGVSSARLIATLAVAGALAGLVLVLVHQWAEPRIQAHQARALSEAVYEVLAAPASYRTAFLVDGAFTTTPSAAADTTSLERIYVGYDEGGRLLGVAVAGAEPGFQDVIRLLFGYDPERGQVVGMKVLESKETPGLGDKIEKDSSFVAEFADVAAPLVGVTPLRAKGAEGEVDMITGATISSRAVIAIINHRLESLDRPIREFWMREAAGVATAAPVEDQAPGSGTTPPGAGTGAAALRGGGGGGGAGR